MPHVKSRSIFRTALLMAASCVGVWALIHHGVVAADENNPPAGNAAAEESLRLLREQARRIVVRVAAGEESRPCELKDSPLIHYSDQVRRLPESTLWVWQLLGQPQVFCKVERVVDAAGVTKSWQYCCVPATSAKADVTWGRDFRWRTRETPFQWHALADVAKPRDLAAARLTQMKAIAREFHGESEQTNVQSRQTMRLLASPLHRYSAPDANVVDGAVFGLASNGTNPDVLLLVEALREPEADSPWRYAIVGMTGDAIEITHRDAKVWTKSFTDGPGDHRSWMWYVSVPR